MIYESKDIRAIYSIMSEAYDKIKELETQSVAGSNLKNRVQGKLIRDFPHILNPKYLSLANGN